MSGFTAEAPERLSEIEAMCSRYYKPHSPHHLANAVCIARLYEESGTVNVLGDHCQSLTESLGQRRVRKR